MKTNPDESDEPTELKVEKYVDPKSATNEYVLVSIVFTLRT